MKRLLLIVFAALALSSLAQNNPYILAVDEYVPAPGQFINTMPEYEEGDNAASMAQKCTEYLANDAGKTVCLGAWGGYITFHFDHPVVNVEGAMDLYIKGNAHKGNAEAGIVMVSQDENGNGLPDDTWYELSGSADEDDFGVRYDYELEYTRLGDSLDVAWSNNLGNAGFINRNPFHQQDYFPAWIESPLTFSLGARTLSFWLCRQSAQYRHFGLLIQYRLGSGTFVERGRQIEICRFCPSIYRPSSGLRMDRRNLDRNFGRGRPSPECRTSCRHRNNLAASKGDSFFIRPPWAKNETRTTRFCHPRKRTHSKKIIIL